MWATGNLSPYEELCIKSFLDKGFEVDLYTYDKNSAQFNDIKLKSAWDILPLEKIAKDFFELKMFAQLADLFRYKLLASYETTWIDTDMLCLNTNFLQEDYVFGFEDDEYVNTGILRYPKDSELAKELLETSERYSLQDITWSELGPKLFTSKLHELKMITFARPKNDFYPIHYSEIGMLFDPSEKHEVEYRLKSSNTLHLWNQILGKQNLVKKIAPPSGSWLRDDFDKLSISFDRKFEHDIPWVLNATKHPSADLMVIDHAVNERNQMETERNQMELVIQEIQRTIGWKFTQIQLLIKKKFNLS